MPLALSRRLIPSLCTFLCVSLLFGGRSTAQTLFTEVTNQAFPRRPIAPRALAFADYNNDGWPDLFISENWGAELELWQNQANGRFVDRTATIRGEIAFGAKGGGAAFGDYDRDGDLDLYLPNGLGVRLDRNALLRNDGGVFRDVGLEAGLDDRLATDNAIWLDYDRDGHLDLYTGEVNLSPGGNRLYRNLGDGTFADVTAEAGLQVSMADDSGILLGSNGGMVAGDFDDDGWPDLYMGIFEHPNRLFLNDGQGGFQDATTADIADPGLAFGAVVGDIDNDGDLDIFQAAGGTNSGDFRSVMLLNLGGGQFLDALEALGLAVLGEGTLSGVAMGDIDNDGDLDLLSAGPHFLFLNNGDGTFTDRTAQSDMSGPNHLALGDYDADGFLDVVFGGKLYRNVGNDHHSLRVELVGRESDRNGIGARLIATSGDLTQTREIFGGRGWDQDELVVHFGLGERTQVDELEIRWPSGQVDLLTDIPVDQKIRVIEGQPQSHPVHPTTWTHSLPASVVDGVTLSIEAAVRPGLFTVDAEIVQITADLSPLGGSAAHPFTANGDGSYTLSTSLPVVASSGWKQILIAIEQATAVGPYQTTLDAEIQVLPSAWPQGDRPLFADAIDGAWQTSDPEGLVLNPQEAEIVYEGDSSLALDGRIDFPEGLNKGPWVASYRLAESVDSGGYQTLRFAFHPGNAALWSIGVLRVSLNLSTSRTVPLFTPFLQRVSFARKEWQVVEIPLQTFHLEGPIESIQFGGELQGTFYLDDIRLIPDDPPANTSVLEELTTVIPQIFTLDQNYPNPFNSGTVIRFALPVGGHVELSIYNLAGQQVATLAQGAREAGTYTVRWDGQDDTGRELASGVYLYRLQTGDGQ